MTDEHQKPTIAEQYAVALSYGVHNRTVLAAGLQHERVGVLLLRLRTEYDAVRGELEQAGQIAPNRVPDRKVLESRIVLARRAGEFDTAESLQHDLERFESRTEAEIKTARAVILVALTALHGARQELGALAVRMGANPKRALEPAIALQLAGRVLDVWLDETCHKCDGTGRLGNRYAGDRDRECTSCKGTGHRRDILGDSLKENFFARDLFAELQRQVAAAAAGIKAAIHADSGPSKPMHPELVRRLAELRGEQAATD
jgi:hypothetical protein